MDTIRPREFIIVKTICHICCTKRTITNYDMDTNISKNRDMDTDADMDRALVDTRFWNSAVKAPANPNLYCTSSMSNKHPRTQKKHLRVPLISKHKSKKN